MSEAENHVQVFDRAAMVRVDTYGDGKCDIRMRVPVRFAADGCGIEADPDRKPTFWSTIHLNFGVQQVPHVFEIAADSLEEATERMAEQAYAAGLAAVEKINAQRTRQSLLAGASPVRSQ